MKAMKATLRNMRENADRSGIVAWSPVTGEEYSADYRDYWYLSEDEPLVDDNGDPMVLAFNSNIGKVEE